MPIKYPENAVTFPNCRFKALQKPKLRPGGADMSDECAWVFDGLGAGPGGGVAEYQAVQTHSRVSNLDNFQSFLHFVSV